MKNDQGTVTVSIGDKEFSKGYTKKIYETADDVLGELQDEKALKTVIDNLNYATDLKLRAKVRADILSESAGPEKAVDKMVKDMVKMRAAVGKPITEEQARKIILALQDQEIAA